MIGNLVYGNGTLDPMHYICIGWKEDGGVRTIECFLLSLREYRKWGGENIATGTVTDGSLRDSRG